MSDVRVPTARWLAARFVPLYVLGLVIAYLIGGAGLLIAGAIVGVIALPIAAPPCGGA